MPPPDSRRKSPSRSVYEYLEGALGLTIATSKRTLTVEHVTQVDEKFIDLKRI